MIKKLATGGMSEVWLACRRSAPQEPLVVKWILPHLSSDPSFVRMLVNEAKVAARLHHPSIARILDLGETDGTFYIAMEYVRGEDLGQLMRQAWKAGQWISHPVSMRIMSECCAALAYAHARTDESGRPLKVVHRDISPQNILLGLDGSVKLVDFGIAKAANLISTTEPGAIKGKFAYMSPEHAAGKPVDHRADIFSAGLVLYELLSGVRPLQRSTEAGTHIAAVQCQIEPPSAVSETPPDLDELVMGALARAPEDRYASAAELQKAIDDAALRKGWFAGPDEIASLVEILFPNRLEEDRALGLLSAPAPAPAAEEEEEEEETLVVTGKVSAHEDGSGPRTPALTPRPGAAPDGRHGGDAASVPEPRPAVPPRLAPPARAVAKEEARLTADDEPAIVTEPNQAGGGRGGDRHPSRVGAGGEAPYRTGLDYPAGRARAESARPRARPPTERATRVASTRRLQVLEGVEGDQGKTMPFPGTTMVVGRGDQCELRLVDPSVSRRHLELVLGPRGTYLRDMASDSGTRVNGKWVDERLLRHEDVIEIGVTRLQFLDEEEAARRVAEEAAVKAEEDARRREEEDRRRAEEEVARLAAEEAARKEEEEKRRAEEEAARLAAEEQARKQEEEAAAERRRQAEEEARKNRPVQAPPGLSVRSWTTLSPQQRLAIVIFVPAQIALVLALVLWLVRSPEPPPNPEQLAAAKAYEVGKALLKGERLKEAVSSLEAAERMWPGIDVDRVLPLAKKELEAFTALEEARQFLRARRFEEARQLLITRDPVSEKLQAERDRFTAELDDAEAAFFQEIRARDSLLAADLTRARQLINRLPDEPRLKLLKRLMAMEDELVTDPTTPRQKAERATRLAVALRTVERRFQARDFDGAIQEGGHLVELTPGEMLIHDRVDELRRLIPSFKSHFEEGVRHAETRNQAAAFAPLRLARQIYREIGFQGPLGAMLDRYLLDAALASGREAMLRQDVAAAGIRYRDAAAIAPRDPRVVDGLARVAGRAAQILADAAARDRERAPRLYIEKLELVRDITPRDSPENLRAREQLRALEDGLPPAPAQKQ